MPLSWLILQRVGSVPLSCLIFRKGSLGIVELDDSMNGSLGVIELADCNGCLADF